MVVPHSGGTGQRSFIVWIYDFGANLLHVYMASVSVAQSSIRVPGNITCNGHVNILHNKI